MTVNKNDTFEWFTSGFHASLSIPVPTGSVLRGPYYVAGSLSDVEPGLSVSSQSFETIVRKTEAYVHEQLADDLFGWVQEIQVIADPGVTDLLVTNSNGERIGVAPDGTFFQEIPAAAYLADAPMVVIASPSEGVYQTDVVGRSQGEYEIVAALVKDFSVASQAAFGGPIEEGVVVTYSSEITSGQMTTTIESVDMVFDKGPASFFEPQLGTLLVAGTDDADKIVVKRNTSNDQLAVSINGDHIGTPNAKPLTSEVQQLSIQGRGGSDHINLGALKGFDGEIIVRGGEGNDHIIGSLGDDILLGGPGNDIIIGGLGDDIIIGGLGSDLLFGSFGSDLLIGGTTAFDASDAALLAIQAEWTNSDHDYQTRVANIRGDESNPDFQGRLNGEFFLKVGGDDETVFEDGDRDILFGGFGLDWFFKEPRDWLLARRRRESVN